MQVQTSVSRYLTHQACRLLMACGYLILQTFRSAFNFLHIIAQQGDITALLRVDNSPSSEYQLHLLLDQTSIMRDILYGKVKKPV